MAGRNAGGPETYEHSLVRSLAALDRQNEYHIFSLNQEAADSFCLTQGNICHHVLWPSNRWLSISTSLPIALLRSKVDLFHATYIPPLFSPVPYVFTLLDISMFVHPELYPSAVRWRLQRLVGRGLRHARLIVCISQYTQDSAIEALNLPRERFLTIPLGVREIFHPIAQEQTRPVLRQKYQIEKPYLLFVGSFVPRKNIVRILEAFHRFRQEAKSDLQLVLVGRKAWGVDEINTAIKQWRLHDSVIQLHDVTDHDLPILYSGSEMFVFPSLDEGFGFPVLEAMACGSPVLTSNLTSLPEVAGDAALLVDPCSVEDIASGMYSLFSNSTLRTTLRAKGLERVKLFTWEQTARQTLEVYRRVLGDPLIGR